MREKLEVTFRDVEQKRHAFSRIVSDYTKGGGRYHNPATELPQAKLDGCEVLANRLMLLDRVPKGGLMAEVGVDRGDFSHEILMRCQPDELHLYDIDLDRLVNPEIVRIANRPESGVRTHAGDSSSNLMEMPDAYFDMIYIDGDHTYDGVVRDVEAAKVKIKPSGLLVFNDYAVWSPQSMFHCGVARAVNNFCLTNPWRLRYLALQPMMYNDVALVREA